MLIIHMLWKIKNSFSYQYFFVSFADHIYNISSYTPDFKLILPKVFFFKSSFHRLSFLNCSTSINDLTFTDMINITRVDGWRIIFYIPLQRHNMLFCTQTYVCTKTGKKFVSSTLTTLASPSFYSANVSTRICGLRLTSISSDYCFCT